MPFLPFSRTLSGLSPRRASTTVPSRPRARSRKYRLGSVYARCFGSPRYRRVNDLLLYLSVRGLGFDNWRDHVISGEQYFVRALLSRAGELPVILDVGAYHGDYAKIARRYSPTAMIYCFEPHPRTFQELEKAAQDHALIALPVACGAQSGDAHLYDFENEDGSRLASLYEDTLRARRDLPLSMHKVEVVTIDEFARARGIEEIELLKIDVEGAELDVLQGASDLLRERRIKAVQFELGEPEAVRNIWVRNFYDLLNGYSLYRLLPRGLLPLGSYRPTTHEVFRFQNIVALLNASAS